MWPWQKEELVTRSFNSSRLNESHQKTICSNKFRTLSHFNLCLHTHSHLHAYKPWSVNWAGYLPTWHPSRSPLVTYFVSNCTQAKNRSHAEAQHTSHQPVHIKGIKYIKRSCVFKRWFRLPAGGETTGRSWHSGQSETLLRHHQASQRTTGKSTWMQGWSSFIIPWGVRFLWILFSLAFLRPFFVTIVSS